MMGFSVKRIIAGLAIINILAIVYFLTASSGSQNYNVPLNRGNKVPDHSKSFLSNDVTSKAPHNGRSDFQASDTDLLHGDSIDPDVNDDSDIQQTVDDVSAATGNDYSTEALNLKHGLDLPFGGIINPFRVLGFYKEVSPELYFAPIYKKKQQYFDDVLYGIRINPNYCDYTDLYNLFNSSNIFDEMHFVAEYPLDSLPRVDVIEKIGINVMPYISMDERSNHEALYDMDIRSTMFFTKKHDFHYSQKIGKQFLCAAQMYNHLPGESAIIRKDYLTGTVNAYSDYYSSKPQCFNKNTIMPRSYRLKNETECRQFFAEINAEAYFVKKKEVPLQFIIKKGFGAHRGSGVFLFDDEQEKLIRQEYASGDSCGKVDASFVAQSYIANPILLDKKNKFDFRMYMLVASVDPVIVYYHDGFLRVSLTGYDLNSTDRSTHLTNTHLSKEKFADASDGNDTLEEELRDYQMWTLEELQEYLLEIGKIDDPNWLDNHLRPKFKKAYIHLVRMSRHALWTHSSVYEMFGLDFMLDEDFNLWLIECNSSPQLIGTTPTKHQLMTRMLKDLFEIQYAYLRSKMKRLLIIAREFTYKLFSDKPFDLEHERKRFAAANKNYLEPEYKISENNTWVKILDENIPGKAAYMGNLEDECIIDRE